MKDRIRLIRKDSGLTQEEFAKKIDLTKNYISLVENGGRTLSDRTVSDLCRIFSINEEWLRTGVGDMKAHLEDEEAAYVSELLEDTDNDLYDLIKSIMKTYCEASESDKTILKSFAKNLKDNLDK